MMNCNRILLALIISLYISASFAADEETVSNVAVKDPSASLQEAEKQIQSAPVKSTEETSLQPAQATDGSESVTQPAPKASVPDSGAQLKPVTPVVESIPQAQPVLQVVEKAAPAPIVVKEVEAPSLKNIRALTVTQQIELLRTAVKESTQEKGIFSRMFSSDINPIDIELLAELRQFSERYAGLPQTDEVFHLMALVHKRTKIFSAAALDWELLKVMYPQSSFVAIANKQLKELSGDQLSKQAAMIEKLNKQIATLSGDMDHRTGSFIEFLGTFREESFANAIAAVATSFLSRNETFMDEDIIESAIAHQAMLLDNDIALYRFNKILAFYPASSRRADSLLSFATIQREKLKLYDKAAKTYLVLIAKHPDSNETLLGYEALATMYNDDMHDYPNAIKTFDEIIAKYKKEPVVLRSLLTLEKVYETKTNQLDKAIETYLRVADTFEQGQDGMNALIGAENIAINSSRNWVQAMSINERIIARSPNSEIALKAQYANADITENKLGDKTKARELYENFIQQHRSDALAKDAKKRIDAIDKK